jgi:hypothetical protein
MPARLLAAAIDEAEADENGGRLTLNVWREGETSHGDRDAAGPGSLQPDHALQLPEDGPHHRQRLSPT